MPKYAIAFHSTNGSFEHHLVEMDSREAALRYFFQNHVDDAYTKDEEGYNYFVEDFEDPDNPMGSILEL